MLEELCSLDKKDANQLPVLTLAYVGDAVYELLIRSNLLKNQNIRVNQLHKKTVELVRAKAQAEALDTVKPHLELDEISIVRRSRNAKIDKCPKNVRLVDYRKATALEALVGYLYLSSDDERIFELLRLIEI